LVGSFDPSRGGGRKRKVQQRVSAFAAKGKPIGPKNHKRRGDGKRRGWGERWALAEKKKGSQLIQQEGRLESPGKKNPGGDCHQKTPEK